MERRSGMWIATTARQPWRTGGVLGTTRRGDVNLVLEGRQDQLWEGFGGCFNELGWHALNALRAADRTRILDALFDPETGCRFNLARLPIGASDYAAEWYSLNESDGDLEMRNFSIERDRGCLIPYIRAALQRRPRLKLFASPWSPPTWMKHPRAYNYGTLVWQPEVLEAYALYLARFVRAYQREGITIHQVHVQNEPVADQKFPRCLWTGAQLRDFIRGYLGPRFRHDRIRAEIWLGTLNTDDYNGYTLTCLSDPLARAFIAGVGYQWAGKGAVHRTHASWPDLRIWQTENECGDGSNGWDHARHVFGLMQHYISGGANAYVYWNMVLKEGGMSTWGWRQNSMITVNPLARTWRLTHEYHVMRHFAQFIDKDAYRLTLSGEWAGNAVAFLNPDDSRILVLQNPLPAARRLVLADGSRLVTAMLPPDSISTIVL